MEQPGNIRELDKSSSETGETQEVGTAGDAYKDEEETYTKDETFDKDNNSSSDNEEDSRETEIVRRTGIGEEQKKKNGNYKKKGKGSAAGDDIDVQSRPSNSLFNYHDKLDDRRKIGSITNINNSDGIGGARKQKQQHKQESGDVWENVAQSTENSRGDDNNSNEDEDAVEDEDKRTGAVSSSSSFSSSHSHPFQNYHKTASTKKQTNNNKLSNSNGAHNVITMSNTKNKLPYALRADRPHFKYPVNYPTLDFVGSGDSLFDTMIPDDEFPSERKKREVCIFVCRIVSSYTHTIVIRQFCLRYCFLCRYLTNHHSKCPSAESTLMALIPQQSLWVCLQS